MLEVGKTYTHAEMESILGTTNNEGIKRKLQGYGVELDWQGNGRARTFTIKEISDPFKLFAITELGCASTTDFQKLANYYFYFFNDVEFSAMPYAEQSLMADERGHYLSRQTASAYKRRLEEKGVICYAGNYLYQIVYNGNRKEIDRETYCQAWREFFAKVGNGTAESDAFSQMISAYGGMPRKYPIPTQSAFTSQITDQLIELIQEEVGKNLSG